MNFDSLPVPLEFLDSFRQVFRSRQFKILSFIMSRKF